MFEEIFQRRNVIVETQRKNPVDAHEIFHASMIIQIDHRFNLFQ